MADIIHLADRRRPVKPAKTWEEVTQDSLNTLLTDWERFARNNRLNDYFKSSLPSITGASQSTNFMADLNAVAVIELKLGVWPVVYFPNTLRKNQHGWIVAFDLGPHRVHTPELANEAYARCFSIMLFLKLKRHALELGLVTD